MAEAKEIKITLYTDERDTNTYVATFIHQQLRGNPNYINDNIILNMDHDDKTFIFIIIDEFLHSDNIPNISIDWNGIERITIEGIDDQDKSRIVKSIKDCYYDYPYMEDNFDMAINDLHPGKIIITGNEPHIVFNLHDWIINNNEENKKEN